MKKHPLGLCIAVILSTPVLAQEVEPKVLDSVVVIGQKAYQPEQMMVGSVDVVTREELAYERVDDTSELFNKVPGVYLSRYNQGLINSDISIHGFAGDGSTPHAKLLIDGIPTNLYNGYSEMDQLFPLGIESVTVFKGTSDPTVGLYNIAGNYRLRSRTDINTTELQMSVGSFDAQDIQLYSGIGGNVLKQNYFVGYRQANGYREHSSIEKYVASGRWALDVSDTTVLSFIARTSGYEGDAPGYLSLTESTLKPTSSATYANQDGGEKNIQHLSAHLDHIFADGLDWSLKAYWQQYERERWVRFSQAGALQNRYDDQQHQGVISSVVWKINPQWTFDAGFDAEFQDITEQRFGAVGQQRVRNTSNVSRNYQIDFMTYGAYVRIGQQLGERFNWNVASRADRLDGDFVQFSASGVPSTRNIYNFGTIIQPKLNVAAKLSNQMSVFVNAGRSFQHPFSADAFTAGDVNARDVSVNDGWETAVKILPHQDIELRVSYWQKYAKDEFVVVDGNAQNVGKTLRTGWELATNWHLNPNFYIWMNYSLIDTEIKRPADAQKAFTANQLRSIPSDTGSLGFTYDLNKSLSWRMHMDHQGSYYVNEANLGGKFGDYTLVHTNVDYKTTWGKVGFQLNNLFDRYYEYVFDNSNNGTDTIHSPGDGRSYSLTLSYDWK